MPPRGRVAAQRRRHLTSDLEDLIEPGPSMPAAQGSRFFVALYRKFDQHLPSLFALFVMMLVSAVVGTFVGKISCLIYIALRRG